MSADRAEYLQILARVRNWSAAQRLHLVQDVLTTLAPAEREARQTLEAARGLLASDRPAPTDADIARLLDERRAERYGV